MRESSLHAAVVQFLALALPREAVFHHSPNEGKRGWQAQRDLKSHGVRKGWPDLEVLYGGKAIFLELKAPGKKLEPHQSEVHRQIKLAGCEVFTIHSLSEAAMALEVCGVPLSASVAA